MIGVGSCYTVDGIPLRTLQAQVFLSLCNILCPLTLTSADAMGPSEGVVGPWEFDVLNLLARCLESFQMALRATGRLTWTEQVTTVVRKEKTHQNLKTESVPVLHAICCHAVQLKWHQHNSLKQEACHWVGQHHSI